jgi:serine protease Do
MDRVRQFTGDHSPSGSVSGKPPAIGAAASQSDDQLSLADQVSLIQRLGELSPIEPAGVQQRSAPRAEPASRERDEVRVQLAWARLLWLLTFLGVLLAITYLVPHMVEQIQYASTRGQQRAQHELAVAELKGEPLAQLSRASQLVSQRVGPSVVHITSQTNTNQVALAGGMPGGWRVHPDGQGSGFVIDKQGHIVTNFHVIDGAREIEVLLGDGRRVLAKLIGQDRETDLALLKVEADGLIPAEWGQSDEAEVGSFVWAVGSPFGLQRSVTSGIISGKHRTGMSRSPYQDFLQTDAAVNPGNSGGPLVNDQGRVIGINTAIVGDAYQGICFAIPSQIAQQIIARLKDEGEVRRGWLGVELAEVETAATNTAMAIPKGAKVLRVINMPDQQSPASRAGILEGDIVLRWDNREVTGPAELRQFVAETKIGRQVKATVNRGGQVVELEVAVGQRPSQL